MADVTKELAERAAVDTAAALVPPVRKTGRKGFLPFTTNLWDRFFISMVCLVAIHLLWLRFVEVFLPLPVAMAISLALMYVIIRRG